MRPTAVENGLAANKSCPYGKKKRLKSQVAFKKGKRK
jgi:hypothetical protein